MSKPCPNRPTPVGRQSDRILMDVICRELATEHTIVLPQVGDSQHDWYELVFNHCLAKARTLSGNVLGRLIVAYPNANLYGVHGGTWVGKNESGPEILHTVAATAIYVRMSEILASPSRRSSERNPQRTTRRVSPATAG